MPKTKTLKTQETEVEIENRINEAGVSMLQHLGYEGRLPDGLVETYNEFKYIKDKIQPGNLTADGYAFVILLYRLKKGFGG